MSATSDLEAGLRKSLPPELHVHIPALATILAEWSASRLQADEAAERLRAVPQIDALLERLAGRKIAASEGVVQFGEGAQAGDVHISGVAARDTITINIYHAEPHKPQPRAARRGWLWPVAIIGALAVVGAVAAPLLLPSTAQPPADTLAGVAPTLAAASAQPPPPTNTAPPVLPGTENLCVDVVGLGVTRAAPLPASGAPRVRGRVQIDRQEAKASPFSTVEDFQPGWRHCAPIDLARWAQSPIPITIILQQDVPVGTPARLDVTLSAGEAIQLHVSLDGSGCRIEFDGAEYRCGDTIPAQAADEPADVPRGMLTFTVYRLP